MSDYAIYEDGILQMVLCNKPEKEVLDSVKHYNRVSPSHKYTSKLVKITMEEV